MDDEAEEGRGRPAGGGRAGWVSLAGSVSLAGLAAHLSEVRPAAELEAEHQGAVGHSVHIFTLCVGNKRTKVIQVIKDNKS